MVCLPSRFVCAFVLDILCEITRNDTTSPAKPVNLHSVLVARCVPRTNKCFLALRIEREKNYSSSTLQINLLSRRTYRRMTVVKAAYLELLFLRFAVLISSFLWQDLPKRHVFVTTVLGIELFAEFSRWASLWSLKVPSKRPPYPAIDKFPRSGLQ